jgi:hypothetical protein
MLSVEIEKQLEEIGERIAANRAEKKTLLKLDKTLKQSLRLLDSETPAKKKPAKARRKKSAPTQATA